MCARFPPLECDGSSAIAGRYLEFFSGSPLGQLLGDFWIEYDGEGFGIGETQRGLVYAGVRSLGQEATQ